MSLLSYIMDTKNLMKIQSILKVYWIIIILLLAQNLQASNRFNISTIGKKDLALPGNISVSLIKFDEVEESGHKNWKTKLVIKEDEKIIIEKYPVIEGLQWDDNHFYYFVPIRNNRYVIDIDHNKDYEFAVVIDHGGNSPSTTAMVYSLKGSKLLIYKEASYLVENGNEIIWNEEKVPSKCSYDFDGKCIIE